MPKTDFATKQSDHLSKKKGKRNDSVETNKIVASSELMVDE